MTITARQTSSRFAIFKTRIKSCLWKVRVDVKNRRKFDANARHLTATGMLSFSRNHQNLAFGDHFLRLSEHRKPKTEHFRHQARLLFPYATGLCSTTKLHEQMPRSWDRRASARLARTATGQLRSTINLPPRHSYALAKSKPY